MICNIKHGLVCDIVKYNFENKDYFKLVVYSDGRLGYISIPADTVKNWRECVGQYTDITCNITIYDGKAKLKIAE